MKFIFENFEDLFLGGFEIEVKLVGKDVKRIEVMSGGEKVI